jgi:hypothetical protein
MTFPDLLIIVTVSMRGILTSVPILLSDKALTGSKEEVQLRVYGGWELRSERYNIGCFLDVKDCQAHQGESKDLVVLRSTGKNSRK